MPVPAAAEPLEPLSMLLVQASVDSRFLLPEPVLVPAEATESLALLLVASVLLFAAAQPLELLSASLLVVSAAAQPLVLLLSSFLMHPAAVDARLLMAEPVDDLLYAFPSPLAVAGRARVAASGRQKLSKAPVHA